MAAVARLVYNEPYVTATMAHEVSLDEDSGGSVAYSWVHRGLAYRLQARVAGAARPLVPGSEAEFITEHRWGYTKQRGDGTKEYRVDHPSWLVWDATESSYESPPTETLYGPRLTKVLGTEPKSAFVALGSEVSVFPGVTVSAVQASTD